jgi:hypothetical protein
MTDQPQSSEKMRQAASPARGDPAEHAIEIEQVQEQLVETMVELGASEEVVQTVHEPAPVYKTPPGRAIADAVRTATDSLVSVFHLRAR